MALSDGRSDNPEELVNAFGSGFLRPTISPDTDPRDTYRHVVALGMVIMEMARRENVSEGFMDALSAANSWSGDALAGRVLGNRVSDDELIELENDGARIAREFLGITEE